jgi:hypothetical protein
MLHVFGLSVLDAGNQLTSSDTIAPQLISHITRETYCNLVRSRLKKRFAALASRRAARNIGGLPTPIAARRRR